MSRKIYYCSKTCQILDWPTHKHVCGKEVTCAIIQNLTLHTESSLADAVFLLRRMGPARGGYTRSPSLVRQMVYIDANPGRDYVFFSPTGPQRIGMPEFLSHLFFRLAMQTAMVTGDRGCISALIEVIVLGLGKEQGFVADQFVKEYGEPGESAVKLVRAQIESRIVSTSPVLTRWMVEFLKTETGSHYLHVANKHPEEPSLEVRREAITDLRAWWACRSRMSGSWSNLPPHSCLTDPKAIFESKFQKKWALVVFDFPPHDFDTHLFRPSNLESPDLFLYAQAAECQNPCRVPNGRSREVKVVGRKIRNWHWWHRKPCGSSPRSATHSPPSAAAASRNAQPARQLAASGCRVVESVRDRWWRKQQQPEGVEYWLAGKHAAMLVLYYSSPSSKRNALMSSLAGASVGGYMQGDPHFRSSVPESWSGGEVLTFRLHQDTESQSNLRQTRQDSGMPAKFREESTQG
ncbi:hypothetical protein C8R44DRAFT_750436 [Mycena epipterygia]|nr:hypothetical protein C8R44DRAFT_750436 [Mycena epipterygia]